MKKQVPSAVSKVMRMLSLRLTPEQRSENARKAWRTKIKKAWDKEKAKA